MALQSAPSGEKPSAGQTALLPEQDSGRSHIPATGLHVVEAERKPSEGQAGELPVQLSATSHAPATARQVVPALA